MAINRWRIKCGTAATQLPLLLGLAACPGLSSASTNATTSSCAINQCTNGGTCVADSTLTPAGFRCACSAAAVAQLNIPPTVFGSLCEIGYSDTALTGPSDQFARAIALDGFSASYVTGYTQDRIAGVPNFAPGHHDSFISKIDVNGNVVCV